MADQTGSRHQEGPASVRLLLLRFGKAGGSARVRSLDEVYRGMFTHWAPHSVYCPGVPECKHHAYKQVVYKGYFAGEWFDQQQSLWIPAVVELTEHAEQDVKQFFRRGSVWQFTKAPDGTKGKKSPLCCAYVCDVDAEALRPSFSVLPVLRTVYRCERIVLDKSNPQPDRVFMSPASDSLGAPKGLLPSEEAPAARTPEEESERQQKIDEWFRARRPSRNGKK